MLVGGEPGTGVKNTRDRLQGLWGATMAEFYGCTEASPLRWVLCPASEAADGTISRLMEDIQIQNWSTLRPTKLWKRVNGALRFAQT